MADGTERDRSAEDPLTDALTVQGQVCFALYAASRAVTDVYRPILDRLGLTYPQYLVLIALGEQAGEPMTVGRLGSTLHLDSGTLSPLLKRLQAAGLVQRQRSARDERVVEVALSDAGRALRARCAAVPAQVGAATGLCAADLLALQQTLTRITTNLQAHRADRQPQE